MMEDERIREVDVVQELFSDYKRVELVRDRYWADLYQDFLVLSENIGSLYDFSKTDDALHDAESLAFFGTDTNMLEEFSLQVNEIVQDIKTRIEDLNSVMSCLKSDIASHVPNGKTLAVGSFEVVGTRGAGLCGEDAIPE